MAKKKARHNKPEQAKDQEKKKHREPALSPETRSSILVIIFGMLGVLSLLVFFDQAGQAGRLFKRGVDFLFGQAAFLVPVILFGTALAALVTFHKKRHLHLYFGMGLIALSVLGFFEILMEGERTGGIVGFGIAYPFLRFFSPGVAAVVFGASFLIGLLVAFDVSLRRAREKIAVSSPETPISETASEQAIEPQTSPPTPSPQPTAEPTRKKTGVLEGLRLALSRSKAVSEADERKTQEPGAGPPQVLAKLDKGYQPPPLNLLDEPGGSPSAGDIRANKNIIKRTLEEFGIEVEMQDVSVGPAVTQYTLKPEKGVKLERITSLQRNLSLALAAHPLRIEAPIPGRSVVGIEIPNKVASIVRLRQILKDLLKNPPSLLSFGLGYNVRGEPVVADLAKMPHLLIAGATGSGKSIAINNILLTFLYLNSPRTLRLILIDPKRVELTPYNGIPHLLAPVVTEAAKAVNALQWAVQEMESRYDKLSRVGARDIVSYNSQVKNRPDCEPLPYLVIVIDELADLMSSYKKEMEAVVVRLAQMARAVGIHLIASTQRPSTDVVTGLIKANITNRIAFKVASQVDSRTILDVAGAEKLLGNGDMLFMRGDSGIRQRIQGTFVSEEEVKRVTDYLRQLETADYETGVLSGQPEVELGKKQAPTDDELYEQAKQAVIEAGKGSASLLQRRLRIGYARAANLLDALEEAGIVGPPRGSKPRQVLIKQNQEQS